MTDGYKRPCPVGIQAPAEMLESWAGYFAGEVEKELAFAISCVDIDDPATLQWLACGIARRLTDLDVDPSPHDPRPDPRTHPEYWTE